MKAWNITEYNLKIELVHFFTIIDLRY